MIKIVTEEVVMPPLDQRRFRKTPKDIDGKRWTITDTEFSRVIYEGKFEEASLICHNLNKKNYLQASKIQKLN